MKLPKTKSKTIFVLAATGSAVGMANVWGFPYKFHKGGIFFLIFYLIFISLFSYVGLSSEFAVGRLGKGSVVKSYEKAIKTGHPKSKLAKYYGYLPLIISLIIAVGYTIIVSYVAKALVDTINGTLLMNPPAVWFEEFSSRSFAVMEIHLLIIVMVVLISLGGFKSVQKLNSVLMPSMILIYLIVLFKMLTLPNIGEGYKLLFRFDLKDFNIGTAISAMGDTLFALSITGFGMIFVGRMLTDDHDIVSNSALTGLFDTIVALLSAFIIVPSIVVFSMANAEGPALIFHILPSIFNSMKVGRGFAVLFYMAIIMAGMTSLQTIFESIAHTLNQEFKINDKTALILVGTTVLLLGVDLHPLARWSNLMDITIYYLIPLGAMLGAVVWFYIMDPKVLLKEINLGAKKKKTSNFISLGKYLYTPLVIVVCLASILFH
ncbi:sodium-dependent transporter [uncultured Anaerococcus sp.]|uniref:sodium-dependent transporter n=1 Tax=uncultured Anaerococcus sp. TaxID=293428 RepID=UPI00261E3D04|nr:sodium-dependent transporter [uncultured Anaerococcus sp.]